MAGGRRKDRGAGPKGARDVAVSPDAGMRHGVSRLSEYDIFLFREGNYYRMFESFGAHPMDVDGVAGVLFCVWAPGAKQVSVIGDFNDWDASRAPLAARWDGSGIWEGFMPGIGPGSLYKFAITPATGAGVLEKGDPVAFSWEAPPRTASRVSDLSYEWHDDSWMAVREKKNGLQAPVSIYEMHPGSWRRVADEDNRSLTYREMAVQLADYLDEMGFTHVELMPVMEHPFYGSWGYQTTGYFAPTSRYGIPQDFMYLVDALHQRGIGVILDWVPSHFPSDAHGLANFNGTHLFEHADPRQGFHPDWKTYVFNYGRNEVRNFLISSALFWLEKYHVDGIRVDAVASMLYLDYSRKEGEWVPNKFGGRENLEAIAFLQRFNQIVYERFPGVQTFAEESTAWPMVSRPLYVGGLGFGLKWNMGWMHDTLDYFSKEPVYRKFHHSQLTFSLMYAFSENFTLPFSHDEVVYGKGSLLNKMPGDQWQKRANLRTLIGYLFTHPGKKLLFMGGEFGQWNEWNHDASLDWHLLAQAEHAQIKKWVQDVARLYRSEPALFERDASQEGFRWIECNDVENSTLAFARFGASAERACVVVCNLTPVPRHGYRIGVPSAGFWQEVLNSDAECYGGSGMGNMGGVHTVPVGSHGYYRSIAVTLPPLSVVVFRLEQ